MVRFQAQVIGINQARRPDGSIAVALALGIPIVVQTEKTPAEQKSASLHVVLPGQPQFTGPTHENRVILFFTESEWNALEHKPTYGEDFEFVSAKDGFRLSLSNREETRGARRR